MLTNVFDQISVDAIDTCGVITTVDAQVDDHAAVYSGRGLVDVACNDRAQEAPGIDVNTDLTLTLVQCDVSNAGRRRLIGRNLIAT